MSVLTNQIQFNDTLRSTFVIKQFPCNQCRRVIVLQSKDPDAWSVTVLVNTNDETGIITSIFNKNDTNVPELPRFKTANELIDQIIHEVLIYETY